MAGLSGVVGACARDETPEGNADAGGVSLIWISLDTLRADHLELHGYERDTSPFLSELARRGLYFEWAIAPQNSTLPVHVTMFSGLHPVVHQVMHSRRRPGIRLADSVRTLPEVLADAGFETRAWTDGGKMDAGYGFARGFQSYEDEPSSLHDRLRAVLAMAQPGRRFFYFIHTYEIHEPYEPPGPYDARYTSSTTSGPGERSLDLYDGSIRFVDDALRDFVSELERRGLLDSTILAITSDHGESFQEYGIPVIGHGGHNLHQNITRVPWIVLHPRSRYRGAVKDLVGLIDFPNTMLALLGIDEALPGDGVNVLADGANTDRDYLSWTGKAWSLYAGDYHLLEFAGGGQARNGLYHRGRDPLEKSPIDTPEVHRQLESRLAERRLALEQERTRWQGDLMERRGMRPEERERLRELGYLVDEPPAADSGAH